MNVHDILARASDTPPPAGWEVSDVLAAGRRRQRRHRLGGACLAVLAISATSYAAVSVPDRSSGDTPPVVATPSPADDHGDSRVGAADEEPLPDGLVSGREQREIAERVAATMIGHLDPGAQHLARHFGGTADRFNPDKKLRSLRLDTGWYDRERQGFVTLTAGPALGRPFCAGESGSPAGMPITKCSEPVTQPDGAVVVVGTGSRQGQEAVLVSARYPSGFTATVYLATVGNSYFLNIGNPKIDPPLTQLPVPVDRLTALVTDAHLRWSIR